jgi:hypothetical protein
MAEKTEPWPGKQNHGRENRIMAGKTEPWLGKQSHGWENRIMAGNFDRTLRVCVLLCLFVANLAKKSGNPGFPGLPPMDYSFTCR